MDSDKLPRHIRHVNFPGVSVSIQELMDALAKHGGEDKLQFLREETIPELERILRSWAPDFDVTNQMLRNKLGGKLFDCGPKPALSTGKYASKASFLPFTVNFYPCSTELTSLRRAVALNIGRLQQRQFIVRSRPASQTAHVVRTYTSTAPRRQYAFHSQMENIPNAAELLASQKPAVVDNPQTLTEKIVQRYAVGLAPGKKVKAGDYVTIRPHACMTHDNTWPVAKKFMNIGATKIHDNSQLVFAIDHDVQNKADTNLLKYRQWVFINMRIEDFARTHGVVFYPPGHGIGHQVMVEEGYAWPGTMTVASDSHSPMYGGIGALGTAIVRSDAASVWATSRTWWQVPNIARITFTGILPPGTTGKDVIVALCGLFNQDEVLNHAIEFTGSEETLRSIPINDRLTIANMTTEFGALSGLFPIDDMLISWYRAKATTAAMLDSSTASRINHKRIDELLENKLTADPGATFAKELYINLSTLSPFIAGPNSVKVATPLKDLESQDIPVNKAYVTRLMYQLASS
ncbi:hypothetical protein ONZ43_g7743 [Nemania bipapillata]|uniref:Uncharacterized protein n=1 Tax=Nemania bipapillata TaxID=110536 RepID=A0ACC2HNQ3_9PEZI|nr:hypothetical protein ONZ43_g7743 [Nemania bipapillata]